MRIALLSTFEESVPPVKYGGTERVVHDLAEALVALGHDVTLLASGDSETSARLIPCVESALRPYIDKNPRTWQYLNWQGLHRALRHLQSEHYDIVGNHGDWPFVIAQAFTDAPVVTTIHNPVQYMFGVSELYEQGTYISISDAERAYLPQLDYAATVHHGIDVDAFEFGDAPGDYVTFLGRIHPDKGPLEAIQLARETGLKLIMAAKIDPLERYYFRKKIKPLIDGKQIVFVGEIAHGAKVALLKQARALVSPIQWDEPFGITNIEAMACGTPVVALRRGSLPEIIEQGKTGFLCDNLGEMRAALARLDTLDRFYCRAYVERHFTARLMAQAYIRVFRDVAARYRSRDALASFR